MIGVRLHAQVEPLLSSDIHHKLHLKGSQNILGIHDAPIYFESSNITYCSFKTLARGQRDQAG